MYCGVVEIIRHLPNFFSGNARVKRVLVSSEHQIYVEMQVTVLISEDFTART